MLCTGSLVIYEIWGPKRKLAENEFENLKTTDQCKLEDRFEKKGQFSIAKIPHITFF